MDNLTIKIKGKEYPLLVSYYVVREISKTQKGKKLSDEEATEKLLWLCIECGCLENGTELDLSKEEFMKIVPFQEFNRVVPKLTEMFDEEKKT